LIANLIVLIYVSAVWGGAFILIKIGEETIAPITEMAGRSVIGFLSLLITSLIMRKDLASHAKHILAFFVFSILGVTLLWLGVAFGEEHVTAGLTSVLVSTAPLVTFVITVFILREERFSISGVTGVILGVVGLILVIGIRNILGSDAIMTGVLLIAGGFTLFAINGIMAPRLATGTDPIVSSTYFLGLASGELVALSFVFESPFKTPINEENLLAELVLGVICTASGFAAYYYLLNKAGALFSSMTFYLLPVFGTVGGIVFLKEKIDLTQVIGIGVVFLGVYFINRLKLRK
jgi:drug/metabolite transporter (DMT)-like permease